MVLVKELKIFHLFLLGKNWQKNLFSDILVRKNAFLDCKIKMAKMAKNWHFSKGVSPWFWSKNRKFSILLF